MTDSLTRSKPDTGRADWFFDRLNASRLPVARYFDDPIAFAHDCIDWPRDGGPTDYQERVWSDLVEKRRTAVRAPHGTGKTAGAAITVLWFALTRDAKGAEWKIPTTASAWYQLTHYLWPEIRKWAGRIRWEQVGREPFKRHIELLERSLKLSHGEAFAVASNEPARIEGAHADELLYVFDEAKAISAETFEAAEGAFSGAGTDTSANAYALAQSTPGDPAGVFYDIHKRRPGLEDWHPIHITLDDAVQAGRISGEWAEQRKKQWGETSAVYQNRVLGEFAASDEDSIIPLSWVEEAMERWRELHPDCAPEDHAPDCPERVTSVVGVDVARTGGDKTVLAHRAGDVLHTLDRYGKQDTMQTVGRVKAACPSGVTARVEIDGMGGPVYDRLKELGVECDSFVAGSASNRTDVSGELGFVNTRAAAWWNMREILEPESSVVLPPDDDLIGDLTAPKYKITSAAKIQVEAKDDIKKRLGRSPDTGDAVAIAFFDAAKGYDASDLKAYGIPKAESWNIG